MLLFFGCSQEVDDFSVQNEKTEFHSKIPSSVSIIDADGEKFSASSISEIENAMDVWSYTFPVDKDTNEEGARYKRMLPCI